jgi:hypothetical protein
MSTFSKVLGGARERKRAHLTLADGTQVPVDVRMLTPMESAAVVSRATEFARERGAAELTDGNPIYDLGIYVHTLAIACLDTERPNEDAKFFDGGHEQILNSEILAPDSIAHLFALYEHHMDEVSLSPSEMDEAGLRRLIESSAKGDMLPFCKLRPGMQWSFVHSMAVLLHKLLSPSTSSGSGSAPGTIEPSPKPESNGSAET